MKPANPRQYRELQTIIDRIENHLDGDIQALPLAKELHISPWHFQRLFKSLTGDTLGNYIRGRRLTQAALLLRETPAGILEIALDVGFHSHEALTRAFKSHFGQTPKQFRANSDCASLQQKPQLNPELLSHRWHDMQLEPTIEQRPARHLAGIATQIPSPFLSNAAYCHLLEPAWWQLLQHCPQLPVTQADTFYGLTLSPSGTYTETEVTYLTAVAVPEDFELPPGMTSHSIPAQTVAVFDIDIVEADTVNKTMDIIYGYWLPSAPYDRAEGNDYEYFTELTDFTKAPGGSQYVLPIQT
ncbi:Right origin-binding protein [BD1-7 clade bacterium]|uniref:Right origin-binding protein n=1 Tax=BD1-7 clade bacterium TaxID=2029982 RepID=A0A5S9MYM4_9GAMM|nr:Right origin-binding protein [BD1-7 clade bacterium]